MVTQKLKPFRCKYRKTSRDWTSLFMCVFITLTDWATLQKSTKYAVAGPVRDLRLIFKMRWTLATISASGLLVPLLSLCPCTTLLTGRRPSIVVHDQPGMNVCSRNFCKEYTGSIEGKNEQRAPGYNSSALLCPLLVDPPAPLGPDTTSNSKHHCFAGYVSIWESKARKESDPLEKVNVLNTLRVVLRRMAYPSMSAAPSNVSPVTNYAVLFLDSLR